MGVCLADLVKKQQITPERAEAMRAVYDELVDQYEPRFGRAAAESMATEKAMKAIDDDFLHRKRVTLLQAQAQGAAIANIKLLSGDGPLSIEGAHALIAPTDRAPYRPVARVQTIIRGEAHAMIDGVLAKHRKTMIGEVRAKEDLHDLTRELFGEETGNLNARELADAWRQTGEYLRGAFNAAGGRIAKLDGWALPQAHDSHAVRKAGFGPWRDALVPLLDRAKMIDRSTGEAMGDAKLEVMLRDMWEAISTDGWSRREPGSVGTGSLANRRGDHRVLHFASADAWQQYASAFGGKTNAFDAMMAHIDGMSRDIAAMRVLGPNPNATVRYLQDSIKRSAMLSGDEKAIARATGGANQLGRLYDTYTGASSRPENRRIAMGFGILKAQQTAAKLGSAMLSAVVDPMTFIHVSAFNGTPIMSALGRYVKMMNPLDHGDQRLAVRLGLVAEEWSNMAASTQRFTGEEMGHEISRRMADFVLRASYLSAHTQHLRWAFGMEQLSFVTHNADKAFGALDPAYQRTLGRYGIGDGVWDAIRATEKRTDQGGDWIFPQDIKDRAAADALMDFVLSETDYAVPVPDLRTRALMNDVATPGTWVGEIVRSAFLFKSFPLSILMLHGRRMLDQEGPWNKAKYALTLMGMLTAGGALAIQLKELAKGRDPREMDNRKFLGAAALQGGGLGIFGDLLSSDENRFGGGIGSTLLGPAVQTVSNVKALTIDNIIAALDDDEKTKPNVGKDAAKVIRQEIPGSSLWYTRLAYERLFADQVQKWIDPKAEEAYGRMEKRAAEQGGGYFAKPGELPGSWRAPDFENTVRNDAEGVEEPVE
jgi:hypothetical protein